VLFGWQDRRGVVERCTPGVFVFPIRIGSGGLVSWHFRSDLDYNLLEDYMSFNYVDRG